MPPAAAGTAAGEPTGANPAIRVATFNIRSGLAPDGPNAWPFRRRRVIEEIRRLDADVVGLQEAFRFQVRALAQALPGYAWVGVGRANGAGLGEHCPVFVRTDRFDVAASWTRWLSDDPTRPGSRYPRARFRRIATAADLVDRGTGHSITVIGTHLDDGVAENRRRGLALIASWIDPDVATIVLGDANAPPGASELAPIAEAGFVSAIPDDAPGSCPGFSRRKDDSRIDHIWIDRHWRAQAGWVVADDDRRPASDHRPVCADVVLDSCAVVDHTGNEGT